MFATTPQRSRTPLLLFASATFLGGIAAAQQLIGAKLQGEPAESVERVVAWTMSFWYMWALLAPFVWWFVRKVPISRKAWLGRALAHVALAFVLSLLHSSVMLWIQLRLGPMEASTNFITLYLGFAGFQLTVNFLAYGALVGAAYSVGFYKAMKQRELAASQLNTQLVEAQLQALRMQLNPHFLFNAMNSIAMLVRKQRSVEAVKTIASLSDLMRHFLDDTVPHEVPLRDEFEFIRKYLAIEQVRFHDRLDIRMEADEKALDARVPNLLLHPLVENAIRHGIARRTAAGSVHITAMQQEDQLVVSVQDDGPGLAVDVGRAHGEGVGLANTRARLHKMYGDRQRLELTDGPDGGAVATVRIPFNTRARATSTDAVA